MVDSCATVKVIQRTFVRLWIQSSITEHCQKGIGKGKCELSDALYTCIAANAPAGLCKYFVFRQNPLNNHLHEIKGLFWLVVAPGVEAAEPAKIPCRLWDKTNPVDDGYPCLTTIYFIKNLKRQNNLVDKESLSIIQTKQQKRLANFVKGVYLHARPDTKTQTFCKGETSGNPMKNHNGSGVAQ